MKKSADKFTAERINELRENIDFSDVHEITDMKGFHLKNYKPVKIAISFRIEDEVNKIDGVKEKSKL